MSHGQYPEKRTEKTPVLFRMMKDSDEPWLIALFPTLPGTNAPSTCLSYMHVGQHAAANLRSLMRHGRAAKPSEYAALAKELRQIGYNLDVKQRVSPAMDRARYAALK
mgnify:CR=1 FL=1